MTQLLTLLRILIILRGKNRSRVSLSRQRFTHTIIIILSKNQMEQFRWIFFKANASVCTWNAIFFRSCLICQIQTQLWSRLCWTHHRHQCQYHPWHLLLEWIQVGNIQTGKSISNRFSFYSKLSKLKVNLSGFGWIRQIFFKYNFDFFQVAPVTAISQCHLLWCTHPTPWTMQLPSVWQHLVQAN